MFGYITIDKKQLSEKEAGLYQTFMCGICLSTKKIFGNYPRVFVSYDINFFNVLFHSFLDTEAAIDSARCFASPFKKRTMLRVNGLTDKIAVANVILNYFNLYDDVVDGSVKKKIVLSAYKRTYKRAQKLMPELDAEVSGKYEQLRALEKRGCDILDKICHNFASLTQSFAKMILAERASPLILDLCYNAGKWVYLIDALDDLEKDHRRGNYNPLTASLGGYRNEKQFVADNREVLNFLFFATLNRIAACYNDLNLTKYRCLLNNVIYRTMRDKTNSLLGKFDEEKK